MLSRRGLDVPPEAIDRDRAGSSISLVLWGAAERLARDFLKGGRSQHLEEGSMSYPQLQGLFPGK